MKRITVGELAEEVNGIGDEVVSARGKTVLKDAFLRWAKENKRHVSSGQALADWLREPASTVLIIKCRI